VAATSSKARRRTAALGEPKSRPPVAVRGGRGFIAQSITPVHPPRVRWQTPSGVIRTRAP
jgi:hypothetical protein